MNSNYYDFFGRFVTDTEYRSWQNSLNKVKDLIEISGLTDNYIALEYQVPYNQNRIDCLFFGESSTQEQVVFIIELKQWDHVKKLEIEGNFVETFTGGGVRTVAHPAQQVKGYHNYLLDFVEEFEAEPPLNLFSCSYCHNYSINDTSGLLDAKYRDVLQEYPVYCKEDVQKLGEELKKKLNNGKGFEIFNRFMRSRIRPSKKLLDNVRKVIENEEVYSLINEQIVAKNVILGKIKKADRTNEKAVILIKGGPGTGKSIIALNILAELAKGNKSALYVCKSKPFRDGLQALVGTGAKNLFISPYFLIPARIRENGLDVVLIDEAHRIEKKNVYRHMRAEFRSDMPQVDQIIRSAKTTVFFVDDKQNVRSSEIGNSEFIKEAAGRYNCSVEEVELLSQFRCMGSNNYLEWIESVLGYRDEKRIYLKNDQFDFRVFESPALLYNALQEKEKKKPNSARLVAGYCWEWHDPRPDGTLVNDVKIGDFEMPWETKGDHGVGEYPPWYQWAHKPKGFEQVGCIYTAQGFEFDYIGVIIGKDLQYDPATDSLVGDISKTADPTLRRDRENFDKYVKNIYRVLLTRGLIGCFVYFFDKKVEDYFRSRMEE